MTDANLPVLRSWASFPLLAEAAVDQQFEAKYNTMSDPKKKAAKDIWPYEVSVGLAAAKTIGCLRQA